jgi:N-acetylglucosamine malate deacetylase 1
VNIPAAHEILPPTPEVLVLSPHPDDESLGCGGTLKVISESGGKIDVVYMTHGELGAHPSATTTEAVRGELGARRSEEATRACRVLGVRRMQFLTGRDGQLDSQPELYRQVLGILQSGGYRSVFCPWPGDGHMDHAATYRLLHRALREYRREIAVWLYEVWTPLQPNIAIAIDATLESKVQAIRQHESQTALMDYVGGFTALAQYRSLFCPSSRHAEAFVNCDSAALLRNEDLPWSTTSSGYN